jgi:hypothetical protein
VDRVEHDGSARFVVDQPDGTLALPPVWMAEPGDAASVPGIPGRRPGRLASFGITSYI